MRDRLVIFTKNPVKGKVKTRLASDIGEELALKVHLILLMKTVHLLKKLPQKIEPVIYFSEKPVKMPEAIVNKQRVEIQNGLDLGQRMSRAINNEKKKGGSRICLIGSDIYDLNVEIIMDAFQCLQKNDIVIGPAEDGGYYLIGMREHHPEVFENIQWGKPTVLSETIDMARKSRLTFQLLDTLNDVDEIGDIPADIAKKLNIRRK